MQHGLLLINLGTPKSNTTKEVKNYLRTFLTDPYVIDLPAVFRYFLVYAFILPFRSKRSAKAYQSIWTEEGSPLLVESQKLLNSLQQAMPENYHVALGMRYGEPSIEQAFNQLKNCETVTVLPLYPQYAKASTGSSIAEVLRILKTWDFPPNLHLIRDFYQHPAYVKAQASLIQPHLQDEKTFVLFSYHGIPERQITPCKNVCQTMCPPIHKKTKGCYKVQCEETSRLIAQSLNLNPEQYQSAFQSRLGKATWIKPYTDEVLQKLAQKDIHQLVVVCPSFVTDCLETLEEIGLRAKEQWQTHSDIPFVLVTSLNNNPLWIKTIQEITQKQS